MTNCHNLVAPTKLDSDWGLGAVAGVAQWIECPYVNQRVTGSIPSQGTCLGCWPGAQ